LLNKSESPVIRFSNINVVRSSNILSKVNSRLNKGTGIFKKPEEIIFSFFYAKIVRILLGFFLSLYIHCFGLVILNLEA